MKLLVHFTYFGCLATSAASVNLRKENDARTLLRPLARPLELGASCSRTEWCPNGFSCSDGKCYHYPRQKGEPCDNGKYSVCHDNFECDDFYCVDRFDAGDRCVGIEQDINSVAGAGHKNWIPASSGQLRVMTYNIMLWDCGQVDLGYCLEESHQHERIEEISKWLKNRDEDVIVVQELYGYIEKIKNAMIEASFCNYITDTKNDYGSRTGGTGLAIFSKYPIEEHDFDNFKGFNLEASYRGIQYAKIRKGAQYVHLFHTHTTSTTADEKIGFGSMTQTMRNRQFRQLRDFINEKQIEENELILIGGDMNQDKFREGDGEEAYEKMLQFLGAASFNDATKGPQYTYDTNKNALVQHIHGEDSRYAELLDYIFYDAYGLKPHSESSCEILIPISTVVNDTDDYKSMLSDHFPVTCTISYPSNVTAPTPGFQWPFYWPYQAAVDIQKASVCDADTWGAGDSDPYIKVTISKNGVEQECGRTTTKNETNEPVWNEMIWCQGVKFNKSDKVVISFDAYDDDSWVNGGPDFIGSGEIELDQSGGNYNDEVKLTNGDCNKDGEDGNLQFYIHFIS